MFGKIKHNNGAKESWRTREAYLTCMDQQAILISSKLPLQQKIDGAVACFPLSSARSIEGMIKSVSMTKLQNTQTNTDREREGGSTSDNGTPPAVTNSSLNIP